MNVTNKDFDMMLRNLVHDLRYAAEAIRGDADAGALATEGFDAYLEDKARIISNALGEPVTTEDLTGDEELMIRYFRTLSERGRNTAIDVIGAMAGWYEGQHAARREIETDVVTFFRGLPEPLRFFLWDSLGALREDVNAGK